MVPQGMLHPVIQPKALSFEPQITGEPDLPHAATAQRSDDLVHVQPRSRAQGHWGLREYSPANPLPLVTSTTACAEYVRILAGANGCARPQRVSRSDFDLASIALTGTF